MVLQAGLEPAAPGLGILCSIHLSYWSLLRLGRAGAAWKEACTLVEGGKNTRSSVPVQAFPAGPGIGR